MARTLNAKDALNDFRSGMNDADLRMKYKLTEKGLESLFNKLLAAGLIKQSELDARKAGASKEEELETVDVEILEEED